MMDFLRRLAPPRATDASRAAAVVQSRFAGDGPLRAVIGQPGRMQRMDGEASSASPDVAAAPDTGHRPTQHPATGPLPLAAAPSRSTAESRSMAANLRSPAPPREPGELPSRHDGNDAPGIPRSPAASAHALAYDVLAQAAGTPHSPAQSAHAAGNNVLPQGSGAAHLPAQSAASGFDAAGPLRTVQHRLHQNEHTANTAHSTVDAHVAASAVFASDDHGSAAILAHLVRPGSPMSEASLAQRVVRARDQRPVIHVTIDRIDVRAPAAAQRPAAPARARAAAPSVSLSDFLRARGSTRSGGAS
jgi:hypothetical protein